MEKLSDDFFSEKAQQVLKVLNGLSVENAKTVLFVVEGKFKDALIQIEPPLSSQELKNSSENTL